MHRVPCPLDIGGFGPAHSVQVEPAESREIGFRLLFVCWHKVTTDLWMCFEMCFDKPSARALASAWIQAGEQALGIRWLPPLTFSIAHPPRAPWATAGFALPTPWVGVRKATLRPGGRKSFEKSGACARAFAAAIVRPALKPGCAFLALGQARMTWETRKSGTNEGK